MGTLLTRVARRSTAVWQAVMSEDLAVEQQPGPYVPAIGHVSFGDLRRLQPIDNDFGFRRGGPVDRYYIESFLQENSGCIRGRTLEVKDDHYVRTYGKGRVTQSDILDIDACNPAATIIADLAKAEKLPVRTASALVVPGQVRGTPGSRSLAR